MRRPDHRLLVFQHHPAEHVGRFSAMLGADGISPHVVQLDQGDAIPDIDDFDGLWVLGGPMQAWDEDNHPWLIAEKRAIREAVAERRMPYFGLCLGHQLLADALGGEIGPSAAPEVGILEVALTADGQASPFLAGLPHTFPCTQGHGAEVKALPDGATVLATSPMCAIQAMQIGTHALSLQFHTELTLDMIEACLELPEYKADFEAMLGADGIKQFLARSTRNAAAFESDAALIYANWISTAFAPGPARGATPG